MSFIGNKAGPRKSELVQKLGPDYFGISHEQLAVEVDLYRDDEASGLVDPVYVDGNGNHYIVFNAPNQATQRFYLEENGYHLEGEVNEILTEDNSCEQR